MKKGLNTKGLSDVVTTVLIILLALVAVAIIGGVVLKNISRGGERIDVTSACQEIDVKPVACNRNTGAVSVSRGADSATITQIKLLYKDSAGTVRSVNATNVPGPLETTALTNVSPAGTPSSVQVAAVIRGSSGTDYNCNPVDTVAQCT